MERVAMENPGIRVPCLVFAGQIYGTIKENGRPVPAGTEVIITCGRRTVSTWTSSSGSYRLYMPVTGPCTLKVRRRNGQEAEIWAYTLDDRMRYNLTLRRDGGTVRLERT
jgi:hypothetical protein